MNIKTNGHFKHLLHTVLLLVMMGWTLSAYAEDKVIFSMTNPTAPTTSLASNTSDELQATIKGGTAIVYNGKDKEASLVSDNAVNLAGSGKSYLQISLSSTCFLAGDVITIKSNETGDKNTFIPAQSGGTAVAFPYTVKKETTFIGSKDLYLRNSGAKKIYSVTITRPPKTIESCDAKWDWKNNVPSTEGFTAKSAIKTIDSNVEGIYLLADAQKGEIKDNGDNLKMANGTELRIPVYNGGIIEFFFHASSETWKKAHINGSTDGLTAQTVSYAITDADLERGYVSLSASATVYLYSVTLKHRLFRDFSLELSTVSGSGPFFPKTETEGTYYLSIDSNNNATHTTAEPAIHNGKFVFNRYNDDQHGYADMVAEIPVVPGRYTITIGNCQFGGGLYNITSADGAISTSINAKAAGNCYAKSNGETTNKTSVTVDVRKSTTLSIKHSNGAYTPYFAMSRTELPEGEVVNVTVTPEGSGTVKGAGEKYPNGSTVTLTAIPEYGYEFVKWMEGDTELSTDNPYSFTMGAQALNYTAVFQTVTMYDVKLKSNPDKAGTLSSAHTKYAPGVSVTVTEKPSTGYEFKNWTDENGNVLSTSSSYTFTMPEKAITLTANYEIKFKVTFDKGEAGGKAPPTLYISNNGTSTFTVPVNTSLYKEGYTLMGWTDGVNTYSIGQEVTVTDNLTLTPVFTPNTVQLSDLTEETTVTWQFGEGNGAPSVNFRSSGGDGTTGYIVNQIKVNGSTIDIPVAIDATNGLLNNSGRNDQWAQINTGTVLTVPSFKKTIVKFGSYQKATKTTVDGQAVTTTEEKNPFYHTATITSEAATIKIDVKDDIGYINSVTVTYPAQKKPSDLKVAIGKENITLNKGGDTYTLTPDVDYYTSSTGAMTFESSIPGVATVDENGVITPLEYGKTTITVRQAGDSNYASGSISYTVKVISAAGQTEKPEVTIGKNGTVTITAVENATVRYTTDGSSPSESSTLYSEPFSAEGKVVKVVAYLDGKSPSDIVTAYVNVTGTFTWKWNTTGVLQTSPIIEGNVADIIDENTKVVIGKKLTQGAETVNGKGTVTVKPTDGIAVTEVDEESTITFNIIPAAGIAFKPNSVSFDAVRISTGSGFMDVYLKNENNDYPLLEKNLPNLDNLTSYNNDSFMAIEDIPAAAEEWSLKYYIYTLTKEKAWGFSNIVVSGTFTGVEYDGVFYKISATAEPAEGGTVTHAPAAGKAQPGKKVTFYASPNKGYRFVKWRDFEGEEAARTTEKFSVESLNKDLSYEAVFEKLPLITFVNNQTETLEGTVPDAAYTNADHKFTIPKNTTLYYEGYALTAWTDGTNTYTVGETYTFTEEVTLKPVLTKSDKAITDTDNPLVATWYFDKKDGAPILSWNGSDYVFNYTKSVTVGETKIDLKMKMTGAKADNDDARVNFVTDANGNEARGGQLNNGMTLTIPAVYGMTVKMQASLKKDDNDGKSKPNETYFQNVPDGGNPATLSFTDGGTTTTAAGTTTIEDRVLTFVYKGDATKLTVKVDNAGSVGTYGYFRCLEVTYPVLPDVKTINVITSTPLITEWEQAENAGKTDKTKPDADGNTGNRYKPGAQVTITANAAYGYYITAFKDGETTLKMTKVAPSVDSDKPTTAKAVYTVQATTDTITVEYARLPMAKVRLETVDKTLGTVDFNPKDIHYNFYDKGEDYVQSWFVVGDTVHGSSDAADDYVLKEWIKEDNTTPAGTGPILSITVPATERPVTYHAYFTLGMPGNIVFDVANAKWLKNGTLTAFSVDPNSTWPENQNNCRSFYIPRYHGLFRTYDSAGNDHGWTLKYWVASDDTTKIYDIGKNYSFRTQDETITLIPVFEENPGGMQNRLNAPVLTYEFGTGPGIRAQKLDLPKNTDTYLCAPVYTEVAENSVIKGHTRDVALWINTGEKGYVRNSGFEEWAAIGPGTTLTIASCAGTKIEILSYAPISSTTIDGVVPTECQQIGEHEYIYSYTTQNPSPRIPIVIGDDYGYYKWIKAHTLPANRVNLHTVSANKDQGEITKTEVITSNKDREYITKLEDGGHSIIQGTRVKVSFERKFGYVFDKIVDSDKIVNGEPLAVLKVNDTAGKIDANTTVDMVNMNDATDVMTVNRNTNEGNGVISWGRNDDKHVFILRQIEPTDEEKRNGKRTRYEVEFEITTHRNLIFYFKEKPTYYVTFNPGKYATGIAPTAKWVEEGDEYTIPQNHTLYYSGYTLKRWKDETGNTTYNIGSTYNAPASDLRLFPEFDLNTFSLLDSDLPEATATWNFARKLGAPDINFERSSGILVTQLHKSNNEFIDLRLSLDASDRKDESGNDVKGKFNNLADPERCQINMHSIMRFPVTKGCEMKLDANSTISTTSICGATAENGGYTSGNKVRYTWHGGEGIQQVYFQNDGRYYTYFSITYKPQTIEKPALESVSYAGTALTAEQINTLKTNKEITLEVCPITLDPVTGKFVSEKMRELAATATGTGKVTVTQPTLDNPTGYIRLYSGGEALLATYMVHFTLKAPTSTVEGAKTTPQFLYTEINGEKFYTHEVSVENMPSSGYITVAFDRTMKAKDLEFTLGGKSMTFSAKQGKELTFYYWNLPNVTLDYKILGTDFVDIYGMPHQEGDFIKHFKTRGTTKEIVHKTFDFIVGADGSLDDAIKAANADKGTDRYLIFIPDGEYQLTGNESLEGRYGITSDGAWPCDGDGNAVTDKEMSEKYNYQNGMTQVTRPKVSIIGQSREGVMVWNRPIVEGIGYTATIHVGGAEDFYAEDFSIENRFPYWSSMGGGSGAGRAVVLWDQGKRTTMKNVSMMSWQDTYYSSNVDTDYRGYFENCQIGGVVDWICGNGNIWFEKCDLVVRDRSGNNLAAPSQDANQQWGYVFNECNIVPEFPLSQTQNLKDKTWTLARPWANDQNQSPACTFIHTKMGVLPKDHGWGSMGSGALLRFHENHTMDAGGTVLSLGARSLAACAPAAGSDDCVMNDTEASKYTIENVLGGSDSFTPKERTMQIDAQSGDNNLHDVVNSKEWDDQIETDDDRLTWNPHPNALCYFIFKLENGKWNYKTNITETSISLDQLSLGTGTYCVRAANQYGGLGAPTKSVDYQEVKRYSLIIAQLGNLKVDGVPYGWSTICLPYNARVPEGVKVYAATAHNENDEAKDVRDYYMTLTETDYLNKDRGYIVYGPAGDYLFKATSRIGTKPTILRGNSSDYPVSSINNSCYILANKTYGLGFYKFTGTELKPYRAWLPADKVVSDVNIGLSSGAKGIRFVFGDNTDLPTGILNSLYGKPGDGDEDQFYNISGQRVKNPASRGIYIRRGQGKVVMGK